MWSWVQILLFAFFCLPGGIRSHSTVTLTLIITSFLGSFFSLVFFAGVLLSPYYNYRVSLDYRVTLDCRVTLECRVTLDCGVTLHCRMSLDCRLSLECRVTLHCMVTLQNPCAHTTSTSDAWRGEASKVCLGRVPTYLCTYRRICSICASLKMQVLGISN